MFKPMPMDRLGDCSKKDTPIPEHTQKTGLPQHSRAQTPCLQSTVATARFCFSPAGFFPLWLFSRGLWARKRQSGLRPLRASVIPTSSHGGNSAILDSELCHGEAPYWRAILAQNPTKKDVGQWDARASAIRPTTVSLSCSVKSPPQKPHV